RQSQAPQRLQIVASRRRGFNDGASVVRAERRHLATCDPRQVDEVGDVETDEPPALGLLEGSMEHAVDVPNRLGCAAGLEQVAIEAMRLMGLLAGQRDAAESWRDVVTHDLLIRT